MKLRFLFTPVAFPTYDNLGTHAPVWGQLEIKLLGEEEISLYRVEWDLLQFCDWLVDHLDYIQHEPLVIAGEKPRPTESLSDAFDRFHERESVAPFSDEESSWFDSLDHYYQRHNMWYGLIGAEMDPIIIGINHGGQGEICVSSKFMHWQYVFEMDEFAQDVRREMAQFLRLCLPKTSDEILSKTVHSLLDRLSNDSECPIPPAPIPATRKLTAPPVKNGRPGSITPLSLN